MLEDHVLFEVGLVAKRFTTAFTYKRFFASVLTQMASQVVFEVELFLTVFAFESFRLTEK
jgi:hypothetical protein